MSDLENLLSMMEMNRPPPLAAQQYYASYIAYLANAQPPSTATVQLYPQQQPHFAPQHKQQQLRKLGIIMFAT